MTNLGKCPRCSAGDMVRGDGEVYCLACGYRIDGDPIDLTNRAADLAVQASSTDPMAQLITAAREVLGALTRRSEKHEAEAERQVSEAKRRRAEVKRVEKALQILEETDPASKPKRPYTAPKCPNCGAHPASTVHKVKCKGELSGAEA